MSSRPQLFFKIGVRRILLISQGHICVKSLFNKAAGPQTCNFIKKEAPTRVFSFEFSKIFKNNMLLYKLYTSDVTCNLRRWNNGYNGICKKDQ